MIHNHYAAKLSELDMQVVESVPPGGNWRNLPASFPSKRVQQIRAGSKGGSRSTYYGRLRWNAPAYTISTYFNRPGNGCFIHPEADRLLTIREAARLQTFPDAYRFVGSVRAQCSQVGNAVPPLIAYALASVLPSGNALDLFAGAGGLSLGFELAGFRSILAVDNDDAALRTYALNRAPFHDATLRADLSTQTGMEAVVCEVRSRLEGEDLKVLLGGPPCQGFSTAGKNRRDDPRNRLVWNYFDLVRTLNPQIVLFENVPAVMWGSNRGVIGSLQSEFSRIGYFSSVAVLHAEAYGVPQLRRRLFLLAARDSTLLNWPVPTHAVVPPHIGKMQPGGIVANRRPVQTVADAISDLPFTSVASPELATEYRAAPSSDLQGWLRGDLELDGYIPTVTSVEAPTTAAHLQLELNT